MRYYTIDYFRLTSSVLVVIYNVNYLFVKFVKRNLIRESYK